MNLNLFTPSLLFYRNKNLILEETVSQTKRYVIALVEVIESVAICKGDRRTIYHQYTHHRYIYNLSPIKDDISDIIVIR